ncbi:CHAT domain-containing protein [Cyathus striatus]|nr:CHAT domain-containing protein [Cyathus striatus]
MATPYLLRTQHSVDLGDTDTAIALYTKASRHIHASGEALIPLLVDLANCYRQRYFISKYPGDVDEAIRRYNSVLDMISSDHSSRATIMDNLAGTFLLRFRETGDMSDFDLSISMRNDLLKKISEDDLLFPDILCNIGNSYFQRFEHTKALEDINMAISLLKRGVDHTPEGDALNPRRITDYGNIYIERAKVTRNPEDSDKAIESFRRAVNLTSEQHPEYGLRVSNLISALEQCFDMLDYIKDIDEAIALQRSYIETINPEILPSQLHNLSRFLRRRYLKSNELFDIMEAISTQRKAVELTSTADENFVTIAEHSLWLLRFQNSRSLSDIEHAISNQRGAAERFAEPIHRIVLGGFLLTKYRLTNTTKDIHDATTILQEVFGMTSNNTTELMTNLCEIGELFMSDYYDTGITENIKNGLTLFEEALNRCSPNDLLRPKILGYIGSALLSRFEQSGKMDDIDNSIANFSEALECTSSDNPDIHSHLNHIGKAFRRRFEHTGNPQDLDRSVTVLEDAIEGLSKQSLFSPMYYSDLGITLLRVFLLKGNQEALEKAIILLREAVKISKDHTNHHIHLSHLGNCLLRRFELTGNFEDIDEAVSLQQAAVYSTMDSHVPLRINLMNLGNAYMFRFQESRNSEDIAEAVAAYRKVRNLVNDENDHPHRPIQLHNLAALYRRFYQLTNDVTHIEAMINVLSDALQHTARTPLVEIYVLEKLAWATIVRFKRSNDIADIDLSVSYYERVLDKTLETHIPYTSALRGLAQALESRFDHTNNQADLQRAVEYYQLVASNSATATSEQFSAAKNWARTLRRLDDSGSLEGYGHAIELLPAVAWLGETMSERHHKLSSRSSLVNEAAVAAINWNRLDLALQWLEEGRSIVWKQLNTFRTPIDDLNEVRPDLAEELRHISNTLERFSTRKEKEMQRMTLNQKMDVQGEARTQRELAKQWDITLSTIRKLPGFEDFLRPANLSKRYKSDHPEGTVIVINVDKERCDALALQQGRQDIVHIPLEKLTYVKAESLRRTLIAHLEKYGIRSRGPRSGRMAKQEKLSMPFEDILIQLWVLVVKPIVTALQLQPSKTPPRIWWCATGPLTFLPIHAAGIYTGKGAGFGAIASDYIVSSYTPTLSTLVSPSCSQHEAPRRLEKLLIVTQPETPHMAPLPQTVEEGKCIQEILKSAGLAVEHLDGKKATVDNVVQRMERSNWIHLACHAIQDPKHPTKSGFYFHDGTLELSTLIAKQLPQADFAFLSACETGTGDEKLPEEAVHLAAGVLQAGYRSVVATMWAIDDNYAPMVAEKMYSYLLEKSNPPNSVDAAHALQEAAKEVRKQMGNSDTSFLTWVPFIYIGI